jgi:hypothetical protein
MSIKQNGGVFGRNPTFNDVTIEGDLIINGEVFTGLDFQGSWNASTNSPALASSTGTNGEFYIVSVAGATDLNGITNWGIGDWAIFNGTVWQRVEGGADGNFNNLTANSLTVDGDASVAGTIGVTADNGTITTGKDSASSRTHWSMNNPNGEVAKWDSNGTDLLHFITDEYKVYTAGNKAFEIDGSGDISFYEDTGTTAKLFWDASAESLGIGTSSPATLAHLYADNATLTIQDSNNFTDTRIKFLNGSSSITGQVVAPSDAAGLEFYYGTLEAMRIDASGNLLVGTTAVQGAGGVTLASAGYVYASRPSSTAIYADRTGSDGTIIDFRKDGTAVGSIGSESGTSFIDGHATASGMRFDTFGVLPRKSGAIANNSVDLGSATTAWQDLYLSSGVYLGGTGAANKLDDVESGNWTPIFNNFSATGTTTNTGTYFKVGRLVYVELNLDLSSPAYTGGGSGTYITGLPFSIAGQFVASIRASTLFNTATFMDNNGGGGNVFFKGSTFTASGIGSVSFMNSSGRLRFAATYYTTA